MSEVINYTQDQVLNMVNEYQQADTDEARKAAVKSLANDLGKTTRSVIAKLSSLGEYISPEKVTKSGNAIVRKITIVSSIASRVGLETNDIKSFGKATKADLEVFLKAFDSQ